jgi:hypothetical protein
MKWQYYFQRAALGPWAHSCHIDGGSAPRTAAVRRRRGEAVGGRRSAPRRAHLTQNFRPLSALSTGSSRLIFHELGPVLIQIAGLANSVNTRIFHVFFHISRKWLRRNDSEAGFFRTDGRFKFFQDFRKSRMDGILEWAEYFLGVNIQNFSSASNRVISL